MPGLDIIKIPAPGGGDMGMWGGMVDEFIKEELRTLLESLVPEEKKITKCRMGDYYEDEDYKGYNQCRSELQDKINKILN